MIVRIFFIELFFAMPGSGFHFIQVPLCRVDAFLALGSNRKWKGLSKVRRRQRCCGLVITGSDILFLPSSFLHLTRSMVAFAFCSFFPFRIPNMATLHTEAIIQNERRILPVVTDQNAYNYSSTQKPRGRLLNRCEKMQDSCFRFVSSFVS